MWSAEHHGKTPSFSTRASPWTRVSASNNLCYPVTVSHASRVCGKIRLGQINKVSVLKDSSGFAFNVFRLCGLNRGRRRNGSKIRREGTESSSDIPVRLTIQGECSPASFLHVILISKHSELSAEGLPPAGILPRAWNQHFVSVCIIEADGKVSMECSTQTVTGSSPIWKEDFELYALLLRIGLQIGCTD